VCAVHGQPARSCDERGRAQRSHGVLQPERPVRPRSGLRDIMLAWPAGTFTVMLVVNLVAQSVLRGGGRPAAWLLLLGILAALELTTLRRHGWVGLPLGRGAIAAAWPDAPDRMSGVIGLAAVPRYHRARVSASFANAVGRAEEREVARILPLWPRVASHRQVPDDAGVTEPSVSPPAGPPPLPPSTPSPPPSVGRSTGCGAARIRGDQRRTTVTDSGLTSLR
jgi:hypothetical protein